MSGSEWVNYVRNGKMIRGSMWLVRFIAMTTAKGSTTNYYSTVNLNYFIKQPIGVIGGRVMSAQVFPLRDVTQHAPAVQVETR